MSDVSEKVIRAYSWCQSLGDAHVAVLRDFARDTLAQLLKAEHERDCFLASDEGCKPCARTDADWKALAERELRGEK